MKNNEINIFDVANYIIEENIKYPCFQKATIKNKKENPDYGKFQFTKYFLSNIIFYVRVESLLKNSVPIFKHETLIASFYGTVYPKILDYYSENTRGYVVKTSARGDSAKLQIKDKNLIRRIVARISKFNSFREFIDINRQQRAYFIARYPKKIEQILGGMQEISIKEYNELNATNKKIIIDQSIEECFKNKKDIFIIDEDCRDECTPPFFCTTTAYYMPPHLKIINPFPRTK